MTAWFKYISNHHRSVLQEIQSFCSESQNRDSSKSSPRALRMPSSISTKLITLCSQCRDVPSAITIFSHFPNCNAFIIIAMIRGLSSNGLNQEAINLFCLERKHRVSNPIATPSLVSSRPVLLCWTFGKVKSLRQLAIECGFESDLFVSVVRRSTIS